MIFNPDSETFLDDVVNHAKTIKSVKGTLQFLETHAVTSETWDFFSRSINQAYFKNLLYTSDDVKKLLDEIEVLNSKIFYLNGGSFNEK